MIDFTAAGTNLSATITAVSDEQFDDPTPCPGRSVRQLLGHLVGLTEAFRAAADKEFGRLTDTNPDSEGWPDPPTDWRTILNTQVPALVASWRKPEAWQGMTRAGGIDLPGEIAGLVALDEVVLHGWDLARATDQAYSVDDTTAEALLDFVSGFDPAGTAGMFGPAVSISGDEPLFNRVLARSGRDPHWLPRSDC